MPRAALWLYRLLCVGYTPLVKIELPLTLCIGTVRLLLVTWGVQGDFRSLLQNVNTFGGFSVVKSQLWKREHR